MATMIQREENNKARTSSSSWLQLPSDLLCEIAKRINSYDDFISFGAVCPSWRSAAINENFNRSPQIPWLLLRTNGCSPVLFNNSKRKFHKPYLPEANSRYDPCFSFASHGWLLIQTSQIFLLHPLTRRKILLPEVIKKSVELIHFTIELSFKAALSSSPTCTENFSVVVTYHRGLAFYKSGHSNWTYLVVDGVTRILDVIFFKDQFYFLDNRGRILVLEVEDDFKTRVILQLPYAVFIHAVYEFQKCYHLVEMELSKSKSLMLVLQRKRDFSHTEAFEVFKLNFENGKCEEVERLDNKALFLGQNSSLCVDVKRRSFRTGYMANRIYFIDTEAASRYRVGREKNLGIYNMQTGRIERSFANNCAYLSPLMWIELLP
ncbi:putative F-box protein At5g55150 [Jatropha curcas]|uniref:putative F-box protein At5g55150 n=1 Tax=Jatropha curcas TaxID=180498 RepID=UPI0005FC3376|nr:putative F-box protein At5g55150 [Jatropha curcas]